jgi:hypothetical protein
VTRIINVPSNVSDRSFEEIFDQTSPLPPDEKILLDCRHCTFATPFGLTALLSLGQTRLVKPSFLVPEDANVASYWARADFFGQGEDLYEFDKRVPRPRIRSSSVVLECTPITKSADVHGVVDKISERAHEILVETLHFSPQITSRFTMALSEVCQNILEHAGRGGWVAVQKYDPKGKRRRVILAVCDVGIGFRQSLEGSHGRRLSDRWDDAAALEDTVMRGVSRFPDKGRGQGLQGVKKFIGQNDGKFSVRSGSARIALVPPWDEDEALIRDLSFFPGAQLQLTIPEKIVTP